MPLSIVLLTSVSCVSLCFCLLSFVLLFLLSSLFFFFFINDTATTEIYTLSLHDALPISSSGCPGFWPARCCGCGGRDRKSTRLNSSHLGISYAVFCLKKKKKKKKKKNNT